MKAMRRQIIRFRDQEDGLVMTEFLIMIPLLLWTFLALFVYWDAFRTINQAQKATYSIADMISRQSDLDTTFINGTQTVTEYLMNNSSSVKIRITSVKYVAATNKMRRIFSKSPGNKLVPLTDADLNMPAMRARIPLMANQDSIVIVETEIGHNPAFSVGIPNHFFDNFVVTRPRYNLQVCLVGVSCPSIM
jgi:Flp pilus assembly protein TadG